MSAKLLESCLTLCNPMDQSPPGSSVHGILQPRILEWVAMPSSRGSSWPRDWTQVSCISCIAGEFFHRWASQGSPQHSTIPLKSIQVVAYTNSSFLYTAMQYSIVWIYHICLTIYLLKNICSHFFLLFLKKYWIFQPKPWDFSAFIYLFSFISRHAGS